jgi:hypothetical protein
MGARDKVVEALRSVFSRHGAVAATSAAMGLATDEVTTTTLLLLCTHVVRPFRPVPALCSVPAFVTVPYGSCEDRYLDMRSVLGLAWF